MYRSVIVHCEDDTLIHAACPKELAIHKGDWCVVECHRLPEFGQIVEVADHDGNLPGKGAIPIVLRRATLQDQSRAKENLLTGRMAAKTVHKRVEELKLALHIVQVRYSFDHAVLHVTFTSEERVELGELIRGLATELRVRVEMRPMGVRDAARLMGGVGVCGRDLCCRTWLREFDAVSVKMAKVQRLALNPGTISGMCGRLKCCLKYEFDNYRELGDNLPRDGAPVHCPGGCGRLCDKDILRQRLKVRLDDGRVMDYAADEVRPVDETHRERKRTS